MRARERRVAALEVALDTRQSMVDDPLTIAWLAGMTIDDIELMESVYGRADEGEIWETILDALTPFERDRVDDLFAERDRLEREMRDQRFNTTRSIR